MIPVGQTLSNCVKKVKIHPRSKTIKQHKFHYLITSTFFVQLVTQVPINRVLPMRIVFYSPTQEPINLFNIQKERENLKKSRHQVRNKTNSNAIEETTTKKAIRQQRRFQFELQAGFVRSKLEGEPLFSCKNYSKKKKKGGGEIGEQ